MSELFIGITSSNSERFLDACLSSISATAKGHSPRVVVLDNDSSDRSAQIARQHGAEVHIRSTSQAQAMNWLFRRSRSRYTLLMHADVVLLADNWFEACRRYLCGACVLVSPMDSGLGPMTRGFSDKPESSFLLFETRKARAISRWYSTRRFGVSWPWRGLNFYGPHVTHALPEELRAQGLCWHPMQVHESPPSPAPIYECLIPAENWRDEYANLCYGFGNFYSLDGIVTHYHNWYDRVGHVAPDSSDVHPTDLLPLAFFGVYGTRFLEDYGSENVKLPKCPPS